jgi:DNA-binding transcriptional regulator YiaG
MTGHQLRAIRERLGLTQPALGVVLARIRNAYAEAHR